MKPLFSILFSIAVFAIAACSKPAAHKAGEAPTAYFKTGHGVSLPESMRKALGIETIDVIEQKFVPRIEVPLHVLRGSEGNLPVTTEASGWISSEQAKGIQSGQAVKILFGDGKSATGTVQKIEKTAFAALGDFEITVAVAAPLPTGAALTGIIEGTSTGEVVTVPKSAVMRTAEGEFVYVANEDYFARTPVKTAARNEETVEIVDGLFAGDLVVSKQVTPLWMTELQTIRAGQSCSHGH
jgi:hypothetical protein